MMINNPFLYGTRIAYIFAPSPVAEVGVDFHNISLFDKTFNKICEILE